MRGRLAWAAVFAALALPAAASATDWTTYGHSIDRVGFNPSEKRLAPRTVKSLKLRWRVRLGSLIDTQPLLASRVRVAPGRSANLVYAGDESGRFVAVNAANGHVVWSRRLGAARSTCPDLPSYGVTGTPQIDRVRESIYVGSNGEVFELGLGTGETKRTWAITDDPVHEHNWSALTLSQGILYAALAGVCDRTPYRGRLVAIDTASGEGAGTWYVTGPSGPFGGGIWSFGGVSADAAGDVYTATGNSAAESQHVGYAEHVVRLDSRLSVLASDYPGVRGADADFGATPLLYQAAGCPPQLAVGNKGGAFFVYDRDRIDQGPVQRIRLGGSSGGAQALVGVAAYWPQARMLFVSNPLPTRGYKAGVVAFRVTRACRLSKAWSAKGPRNLTSTPTVANGVVYYGAGFDGTVRALSARTGKRLRTLSVHGPIFAAPSVVGGAVYAGRGTGSCTRSGRSQRSRMRRRAESGA